MISKLVEDLHRRARVKLTAKTTDVANVESSHGVPHAGSIRALKSWKDPEN